MLKNFIALIFFLSLLGVHAQENLDCSATFSLETGELSLPCVTILGGGQEKQTYQVNMQQVAPKEDFHFVVTQTQEVSRSEAFQKEIPFAVIFESNGGGIYYAENFLAIRNEEDFTSLWQKLFPKEDKYPHLQPQKPVIDFKKEMLIAVFAGVFGNEGVRIKVKKIIEQRNQFNRYNALVSVAVIFVSPDSHAGLTDGYISPYQLIRVKSLSQPILVNTSFEYSSSWPPE